MTKPTRALTFRFVETAAVGKHHDGDGLYLLVRETGARSWTQRLTIKGRRTEIGLGPYPEITLKEARDLSLDVRRAALKGDSPVGRKKREKAPLTFGAFADDFVAHRKKISPDGNAKHHAQWSMTLGDAYCASIRKKPVSEITTNDILAILEPIWGTKRETASRIRQRIEAVLNSAKTKGLFQGDNPARLKGHLDQSLGKVQKKLDAHHAALPFSEAPAFVNRLRAMEGGMASKALEFTILTAVRTSEALEARWSEIDFAERRWTIPAARMKATAEHRVPLSEAALAVLRAVQGGVQSEWIFPSPQSRRPAPLSNMAMAATMKRMGFNGKGQPRATVHGFRSTFRDWASETNAAPHEVAEMALAHTVASKTERAYRRHDLYDQRTLLMSKWADYLGGVK